MSSITLRNISKSFYYRGLTKGGFSQRVLGSKKEILHSTSFTIEEGEVVAFVGNNGAGKTTILKIIAGMYEPSSGSLEVPTAKLFLGGSSTGFPPRLSVREAVSYIGLLLGVTKKDIQQQYENILSFAELQEVENVKLFQLSRGMAHRLYFSTIIHLSLLKKPDVVILDEAFSRGGDIMFRQKAEERVESYIAEGTTILFASHNLALVQRHATRVLWLDKGVVRMDGNPKEVLSAYRLFVNRGCK